MRIKKAVPCNRIFLKPGLMFVYKAWLLGHAYITYMQLFLALQSCFKFFTYNHHIQYIVTVLLINVYVHEPDKVQYVMPPVITINALLMSPVIMIHA